MAFWCFCYIFPTANKTIQIEAYINKVAIEIEVDVNNINVLIDNENGITITINCRDSENNKTEVLKKIMNSMKFITDKVKFSGKEDAFKGELDLGRVPLPVEEEQENAEEVPVLPFDEGLDLFW